jgi:hypothetical protein
VTPEDILYYVDAGDSVFTVADGTQYGYDKMRGQRIHFRENGGEWKEIDFNDAPEKFKRELEERALRRAASAPVDAALKSINATLYPKTVSEEQHADYLTAWRYLHTPDNAFLTYCARLIFDYHALDRELMQAVLLGMTRARYLSPSSALLHYDCTGASGAGKNDLVNRITALISPAYLALYSTVSPTALQYDTIERVRDEKGRVIEVKTNKDAFSGKIIAITEVADAAGFSALKALAETDENAEYTHMATVNGQSIKMTIRGPRCVIITSVEGVNDEQIKRRFIHGSVSEDSAENKEAKLKLIEKLLSERKDINDDPRLAVARAGIDLIFATQDVVFEKPDFEAWELVKELNALFLEAGYGLTSIKQFYTLCECLALWKRYERGYTRVEPEDVQEAWFLLATFERETITKTSRQGIAVLKAMKTLCDDYDALLESNPQSEQHEALRPTRRDVIKESDVSQAHAYRLLSTRENEQGRLGELIELGYVRDCESNGQRAVELTKLGKTVLGAVPNYAIVNASEYEPKEPIISSDELDLAPLLVGLDNILEKTKRRTEDAQDKKLSL